MNFTSVVRELETKMADKAPAEGLPMPCRKCGAMTAHATLRMYGAQCLDCYRSDSQQTGPSPRYDARQGPKAWAYALRDRERSGERLSGAQKQMWRSAIGDVE